MARPTTTRLKLASAIPLVAVLAAACAGPSHSAVNFADLVPKAAPVSTGSVTDHVVIVSLDGLRPDAIAHFNAKTLTRLEREGSYSLAATTIDPSKTLPSHTSMLTGEPPNKHGITWNTNETATHAHLAVPTVFALAHERGLQTAAFFSKGKFNHLEEPGTLDYAQAPDGDGRWSASRTLVDVEQYLKVAKPNLLFVHLGEPDYAGHVWGWMSWMYGRAVRTADEGVARIVAAADGAFGKAQYTLIVTADHGGHGRTHGTERPEDMTIPWIAWGKGVQPGGHQLDRGIHTMDTAGTALWLLGVQAPKECAGVAVRGAFTEPTRAAADLAIKSAPVLAHSAAAGAP